MIKITRATKKETEKFSVKEWRKADIIHYGKRVDWEYREFRFKATENGKLVGLLTGEYEVGIIYVESIITAEDARRKGIGTMLLQKVEELGKKLGAHKIWLMTGKDWKERTFYDKSGFRVEGILPNHHAHQDFVIYSKIIK